MNQSTVSENRAAPKTSTSLDFRVLKLAVQRQFNLMKGASVFRAAIDKDEIWNLYLASFPEGSNPRFRERSEHDCSCCRAFVKNAGGMVSIVDGEIVTLWDIQADGYQPVVDALADYVRSKVITNVFLYPDKAIGVDKNFEEGESGVRTWEHFHLSLSDALYCKNTDIGPRLSEYQAMHDVVLRSLLEITPDAIETVQDLISQNSLYRGTEKKALLDTFAGMKRQFDGLSISGHGLYAWQQVIGPNAWVCRMRNDVIGTLLVDLSEGKELESAVKSFEDKVSGTNYKRPTALITPKMRDAAKAKLTEIGLIDALERRYARLEDVSITNVLFADRNAKTRMVGDVFDELPVAGKVAKSFDHVEEIGIDKFIADVLPTATSLEVLVENRHSSNLVSLIAPQDLTAKTLFKWDNPFSWSYSGDVADSIKERVKSAGGNVTGDVCCRLVWYNTDDLDLHMVEPGCHIYYGHKQSRASGGQLDVDMNVGNCVRDPVENIFYGRQADMPKGTYILSVNQFTKRETKDVGFDVEIDVLGTVHRFSYANAVTGTVDVARLNVTESGIEVVPIMPSSQATRELWGIATQQFHPVTALMLSPNFWDGRGVGNKHFFFMLQGCKNAGDARGFYNEFLSGELEPHRKVMEIVGSRMRTEESEEQLSGLGFSSTFRNTLIVKVHGSFDRTLKVIF